MKKLMLMGMAVAMSINGYALSTQEIVNKSLPSIVAVLQDTNDTQGFEGTGWFISSNRIVTNYHMINGSYTGIRFVNVATGQQYTVDHVCYANAATDVAVIQVDQTNPTYLNLSTLTMNPAEGMPVVMIGNPKGEFGKVTEGTLGITSNSAPTKADSGTIVIAVVKGGASGSPVLDPNGDVIGMIWGSKDVENGGYGLAVNIQTLTLANLTTIDINLSSKALVSASPTPAPESPVQDADAIPGLVVPKQFGATRQHGKDISLTQVLDDQARASIASPVTLYITESLKGTSLPGLFLTTIHRFFDEKELTYAQAKAIDDAYNLKWVKRNITIDYTRISVEKMNWNGGTTYLVGVPISFSMTDKKGNHRTGSSWTMAFVQPSIHMGTKQPDYFIAGIWSETN